MPTILHQGRQLRYAVRRTPRKKTAALKIYPDGRVEMLSPRAMSLEDLRLFVSRRAKWIWERQDYFRNLTLKNPVKEIKSGETFPVLGRNFRLKLKREPGLKTPYCRRQGRGLEIWVDGQTGPALKDAAWRALREWYFELTEKSAKAAVHKYAKALAVKPQRLKIGDQSKRWASCSKSGDIRFNWRLSMMPISVLEYVVVHELCHLKTHDHSPRFWRVVKSLLPDYEKRRDWLRRCGAEIVSILED